MESRKPLFVYDCDGTLQGPTAFAYGLAKKFNQTNLSCAEFKKQYPGEKVLLPGMADLVRYTAILGNNVLISGGSPDKEGCSGLLELKNYFQNWQFNGKDVPWGHTPNNLIKASPVIAKTLLQTFHPSWIMVIGDSDVDDYAMGLYLSIFASKMPQSDKSHAPVEVLFMKRGMKDEECCIDAAVPLVAFESGLQMKQFVEEFVSDRQKQERGAHASSMLQERLKHLKLLAPSK